ncbi:hypothetical protein GcM1_158003 [Golovinomyces cichoracearum]|uniref:Uncharacterized protein n=1 Tax=Golovinomyces cichoracearum TaxID=62708 RepID=A0A420J9R7_9PEZI|nr:hypothetical protein GcM1_158003 [Golovinomyces cichoracearum]
MPLDSEIAHQLQNSKLGDQEALSLAREVQSSLSTEPKSVHLSDPFLRPFLDPSFDPPDYFNNNLPSLHGSKAPFSVKNSVPLTELAPLSQTAVSQLSANTARLNAVLTQLTDEILRSGSRLAYEVELLRGNTLNLSEALTEVLHDDLARFIPVDLDNDLKKNTEEQKTPTGLPDKLSGTIFNTKSDHPKIQEPPFIQQLRVLTLVRSRLESVINVFDDAMAWSFPPSEVSTASSFFSVSGPEIGSGIHGCSTEDKGQKVSKKIRSEISEALNHKDPIHGIESATKRVEEFENLAIVWKGTSEERARLKFIENLAKMVKERHRDLMRDTEQNLRLRQSPKKALEAIDANEESKPETGYGFISQLQKLRGPL